MWSILWVVCLSTDLCAQFNIWQVQYNCIQLFLRDDIGSLLSIVVVISLWKSSYVLQTILCKSIYHTQRIVGFFILCVWRVFPRYILSLIVDWFIWLICGADLYDWFMKMIYVVDIIVKFRCGWYIYEIHIWLIYSYAVGLWDTNVLKFIDKSFKVQASPIFHKHQQIKPPTPLRP